MNELVNMGITFFENIKHIDKYGNEYWYARELQHALDYKEWRKFVGAIQKAKFACDNSSINTNNHFAVQRKMVGIGSKTQRKVIDYKLSRYACYLIVMNGNPKKEIITLGQTYFAIHSRKQELNKEGYKLYHFSTQEK